jgi:DNA-damage-inducible protein J
MREDAMAQVNFRIDDDVKTEAEALFARLGMNLSTAINVFIHQALACRGLPFEVVEAPFFSPRNMMHLRKVSSDYAARRNFSQHELIEVDESGE